MPHDDATLSAASAGSAKTVYLCGPINGCSDDEATTWREWFKSCTPGNAYVDPMKRDYRGREVDDYREIVDLDKRDIRGCDVVVVMYVKPSVGTSMEVFYAWTLGIPVVVIDESDKPLSPWMRYHATAVVRSKEEAAKKLGEW
jgi:nucleoside 2-deoxyribosyltransferase